MLSSVLLLVLSGLEEDYTRWKSRGQCGMYSLEAMEIDDSHLGFRIWFSRYTLLRTRFATDTLLRVSFLHRRNSGSF